MTSDLLSHGELSVTCIAKLARTVKQCDIDIHSQGISDETAQQELFETRLNAWMDAPLWVERWQVEERACFDVYLSEGEMLCSQRRVRKPRRDGAAHTLCTPPLAGSGRALSTFENCTLGELIATQSGRDALRSRLDEKYVAPYAETDLVGLDLEQSNTVWAWSESQLHPIALLDAPMLATSPGLSGRRVLCIPSAWGELCANWLGGLHLHFDGVLVVCNEQGRYGLVRLNQIAKMPPFIVGEWMQPCEWFYLGDAGSSPCKFVEATGTIEPDVRGELVCDLISTGDGRRVNPPGIKGLLGTTHYSGANYEGCLVVNEAGYGRHTRVLGRVTRHGVLLRGQVVEEDGVDLTAWSLDDLRWIAMGTQSEGMMAVCSPENGRWGYVDRYGAEVIAPQFDLARHFEHGSAVARLPGCQFVGLIDTAGQWVMPAVWRTIERWSSRVIVAEDSEGHWGALDAQGNVTVPFQPFADWLAQPEMRERLADYRIGRSWQTDQEEEIRRTLIEWIATLLKIEFRNKIRTALNTAIESGGNLAGMEGIFDDDTSEGDLRRIGLWNLPVTLLQDKQDGMLQPCAGESGRIAFYYPVILSTFDLSVEAPVIGLATCPDASVGIPWRNLTVRRADDKPKAN